MIGYTIANGIAAALLWIMFIACHAWNEKAQTLRSHGFSVFTFFMALSFTAFGVAEIIKMAGAQ